MCWQRRQRVNRVKPIDQDRVGASYLLEPEQRQLGPSHIVRQPLIIRGLLQTDHERHRPLPARHSHSSPTHH